MLEHAGDEQEGDERREAECETPPDRAAARRSECLHCAPCATRSVPCGAVSAAATVRHAGRTVATVEVRTQEDLERLEVILKLTRDLGVNPANNEPIAKHTR